MNSIRINSKVTAMLCSCAMITSETPTVSPWFNSHSRSVEMVRAVRLKMSNKETDRLVILTNEEYQAFKRKFLAEKLLSETKREENLKRLEKLSKELLTEAKPTEEVSEGQLKTLGDNLLEKLDHLQDAANFHIEECGKNMLKFTLLQKVKDAINLISEKNDERARDPYKSLWKHLESFDRDSAKEFTEEDGTKFPKISLIKFFPKVNTFVNQMRMLPSSEENDSAETQEGNRNSQEALASVQKVKELLNTEEPEESSLLEHFSKMSVFEKVFEAINPSGFQESFMDGEEDEKIVQLYQGNVKFYRHYRFSYIRETLKQKNEDPNNRHVYELTQDEWTALKLPTYPIVDKITKSLHDQGSWAVYDPVKWRKITDLVHLKFAGKECDDFRKAFSEVTYSIFQVEQQQGGDAEELWIKRKLRGTLLDLPKKMLEYVSKLSQQSRDEIKRKHREFFGWDDINGAWSEGASSDYSEERPSQRRRAVFSGVAGVAALGAAGLAGFEAYNRFNEHWSELNSEVDAANDKALASWNKEVYINPDIKTASGGKGTVLKYHMQKSDHGTKIFAKYDDGSLILEQVRFAGGNHVNLDVETALQGVPAGDPYYMPEDLILAGKAYLYVAEGLKRRRMRNFDKFTSTGDMIKGYPDLSEYLDRALEKNRWLRLQRDSRNSNGERDWDGAAFLDGLNCILAYDQQADSTSPISWADFSEGRLENRARFPGETTETRDLWDRLRVTDMFMKAKRSKKNMTAKAFWDNNAAELQAMRFYGDQTWDEISFRQMNCEKVWKGTDGWQYELRDVGQRYESKLTLVGMKNEREVFKQTVTKQNGSSGRINYACQVDPDALQVVTNADAQELGFTTTGSPAPADHHELMGVVANIFSEETDGDAGLCSFVLVVVCVILVLGSFVLFYFMCKHKSHRREALEGL